MSLLINSIEKSMLEFSSNADGFSGTFSFPDDFIGFQGHFQDNPVLPGVCKVQTVKSLLERHLARKVRLKKIVLAKFFMPATCHEKLLFSCTKKLLSGNIIETEAVVTRNSEKISKLKLEFIPEGTSDAS